MEYSGINDTGFQDILCVIELPFRTFRNIPVTMEICLQGIQGHSLEFMGIQGNTGKQGDLQGNMFKHRNSQ